MNTGSTPPRPGYSGRRQSAQVARTVHVAVDDRRQNTGTSGSAPGPWSSLCTRPQPSHQRRGTDSGTADLGVTARQRPPVKRLRVFDVAHRGQL